MRRPPKPAGLDLIEHMRNHSDYPESGCWELRGRRDKDGYTKVSEGGKYYQSHRYAFIRLRDPGLTPEVLLMHRCDNPPCWNPDHMQPGTHAQNQTEKHTKGRQYVPLPLAVRPRFTWLP